MARARDVTALPPRRHGALAVRAALVAARVLASALSMTIPAGASGQGGQRAQPRIQVEARADYIDARASAAHLGIGANVPASTYVRLGAVAAAGQAWSGGTTSVAARVDALARFVFDPLRESRWAPYASGGVGALYDEHERWRAVLVGALGIEGPASGRLVPAVEVGFGGGVRVGVALRRAMPGRR